jgi:5-methyltetrahydropteroyltriglutamate--homocysteine methyltransferase
VNSAVIDASGPVNGKVTPILYGEDVCAATIAGAAASDATKTDRFMVLLLMTAYRADHIGSFLRSPELLAAHRAGAERERLRALEDRDITALLEHQRAAGFTIFTDGEVRRRSFQINLLESVEGFNVGQSELQMAQATQRRPQGIAVAPLRQVRRLTGDEVPFLKAHAPGAIKVTTASPTQYPANAWQRGVSEAAYADRSALLRDITAIVAREMRALADDGVDYIQLDAPRYSYYLDPKWRAWLSEHTGTDAERQLDEALAADNACLAAARRPGVTLGIHLCRGNSRSQWYAEGGYDAIAERLFSTLDADRFLLEYDDERSGTFAPLRFVPKGKVVVLGLITTKRPQLERPDDVARRIAEAAKVLPLEQLALSPQCGFASNLEGNLLSEREQWAKMALVAEVTRTVWGTTA